VWVEHVGAHTPGHVFVHVSSGGREAIMLGHVVVTALHLVTGLCPQQHPDPEAAQRRIDALLDEDAVLIGPLWPTPGAGRWDGKQLVASS
jgi:glyoxylase-like metal-dependent hydrolase (beta-lactamase superfamily II)